jgi:hypothetical protein
LSFGCAPSWPSRAPAGGGNTCYLTDPSTGQDLAMDCGKLMLCQYPVCRCNATECTAASTTGISCDLHFYAAEATGSCTGIDTFTGAIPGGVTGSVRLFRVD